MDEILLSGDQRILVSLLVQVALMACLASLMATTRFYKRLLRQEAMRPADPLWFALSWGTSLAVGVGWRLSLGYAAADLSLSGTLLAGVFAGPAGGMLTGALAGGAASLRGEWLALPLLVTAGLLGGALLQLPDARQQRWEYSPYPYMNVFRLLRAHGRRYFVPVILSVICLGFDVARSALSLHFGKAFLWSHEPTRDIVQCAVWLTSLITLGVPLKIWNNSRLEARLKEQEALAVRARLDALTQQINPHFLFNTLNSISSAARIDPDVARHLIQKLSAILRRVLDTQKTFVPLAEELEYIDAYLDIEVVRFGEEKLRIVKDVDAAACTALVPCMVLQPIVENAVLHGIAPLSAGGTITIRARAGAGRVHIEIEDNGAGFDARSLDLDAGTPARGTGGTGGIGLANVHQRLRMAYGRGVEIRAERGVGTHVGFDVPFAPSRELLEAQHAT